MLKTERQALILPIVSSLLVGVLAIFFSIMTDSEAIMLDGLFNLAYCMTAIFALRVSSLMDGRENPRFVFGFALFEPLANIIKGLLMLGVVFLALYGALEAVFTGGRSISAGLAVVYGVIATVVGFGTAALMWQASKRLQSPLVSADVKNWFLNGLISSIVLMGFGIIPLLQEAGYDELSRYVDPSLVIAVVICTILVPIRLFWDSLMELLGYTAPAALRQELRAAVRDALSDLPHDRLALRISKVGRAPVVLAYVLLPADSNLTMAQLDKGRWAAYRALRTLYPKVVFELTFTADPTWISGDSKEEAQAPD
ncbi:cation diffusion facilitator family transporter [Rhodovibrionaceae bacterium A322]